jgi:hypothetical protein
MFDLTLPWPPGAYAPETPILHLPEEMLTIYGREHVSLVGPLEIEYTAW